ncbi:MAG: cysteine rich repeat-containing protein, partial [Xanthobacteraceae bacterium]
MLSKLREILATAAVVLAITTAANAQTQLQSKFEARLNAALKKVQTACDEDLRKYCGAVTPGEGRLLLCLEAHEDKIGTKCDYSLFEASRNLDKALDSVAETAEACWNDVEKYCANTPEGGGHIIQCLFGKKDDLTSACRSRLGKLF